MADSVRSFSAFGQQCQQLIGDAIGHRDIETTHYLTGTERTPLGARISSCPARLTPRPTPGHRLPSFGWRGMSCPELTAENTGPKGFDSEDRKETIVPAALSRREKRATPNCERQRGFRPGCGLIGVDAQGARVAYRRNHTSWLTGIRLTESETLTVVEATTPGRQEPSVAPNPTTHASEFLSDAFEDLGSIPSGSTTESVPLAGGSTHGGSAHDRLSPQGAACAREVPVSSRAIRTVEKHAPNHVVHRQPSAPEGWRPSCSANGVVTYATAGQQAASPITREPIANLPGLPVGLAFISEAA